VVGGAADASHPVPARCPHQRHRSLLQPLPTLELCSSLVAIAVLVALRPLAASAISRCQTSTSSSHSGGCGIATTVGIATRVSGAVTARPSSRLPPVRGTTCTAAQLQVQLTMLLLRCQMLLRRRHRL
jgi:hypothetical protein